MKKMLLFGFLIFLIVCILPVAALDWNWSIDGWNGWSHTASWSGTETGPNYEYGPFIVNGYGVFGTNVSLLAGMTSTSVQNTFIDPTGTGWNYIIFKGRITESDVPVGRWMKIKINNQEVFSGNALSYPPGNNGQNFEIKRSFPLSDIVTVNISNGQSPAWGPYFGMRYYSLELISPGSLEVKSSPSHAKIYINGEDTGKVAKWTFDDMAPGDYDVYVTLEGYTTPATEHVTVMSEQTAKLHFMLKKDKTPVPEFPSPYPAITIIGVLGVVFYIKRTREN
jgi:hypothetical protein